MRILPSVSKKMLIFAVETFGEKNYSPQVNLGNSYDKANRLYPPLKTTFQCGLLLILLSRHS